MDGVAFHVTRSNILPFWTPAFFEIDWLID